MIEIIPNWHPLFVHFTLGLLLTSAALFALGGTISAGPFGPQATITARWTLWIGAGFAVVTVAAGYRAYYTVEHDDPAHAAMLIHLKWAWVALALFLAAAGLAWRERMRARGAGAVLATVIAAGTGALLVTGYLGAENVYRHGLGVMRLPVAEGPGHEHGHGARQGEPEHSHEHPRQESAPDREDTASLPNAAAEAAAAVDAFHAALANGDLDGARGFLEPDVRIFEGGGAEQSAEEYASHHMQSDAAFLKDAEVTLLSQSGDAAGGLAWIATESTIVQRGESRAAGIVSTETMVLRESPAGWRILHIHWSSRPLAGEDHEDKAPGHDPDAAHHEATPPGPASAAPPHEHDGHEH